jgi:hypothetical protein
LVDNRQIVFIKRGAFDGNHGRRGSAGPTGLMILSVRLDGKRRAFGDRSPDLFLSTNRIGMVGLTGYDWARLGTTG